MIKFIPFFYILLLFPNGLVGQPLNIDHVVNNKPFATSEFCNLIALSSENSFTILDDNNIVKYSFETGKIIDTILNIKDYPQIKNIHSYQYSFDEKKIILSTNISPKYRHSLLADYFMYDIENQSMNAICKEQSQAVLPSPINNQEIAFVKDYNIFISTKNKATQITFDGQENSISNGIADWVNEEEFSILRALEWSPDGNFMAYLKFNQSRVADYFIPVYNNTYPDINKYKYPKAGEKTSTISLHLHNLRNFSHKKIEFPDNDITYIPKILWLNASQLLAVTTNRNQNKIKIFAVETASGICKLVFQDSTDTYFDDMYQNMITVAGDKEFFYLSNQSGFYNIYSYNVDSQRLKPITNNQEDIQKIIKYNQQDSTLYFSKSDNNGLDNSLYALQLKDNSTIKISNLLGNNQLVVNHNFSQFIIGNETANRPKIYYLKSPSSNDTIEIKNNNNVIDSISTYKITPKKFIQIPINDSINLNASLIFPPDFDSTKKYPLLVYTYGGPGSQAVKNQPVSFDIWHQYLAQQGFIVATIDNRGTGGRGKIFQDYSYLQLGKIETADQILATQYLARQNFIDSQKIGIWGWSYGGYLALKCITQDSNLFKFAIAVAPVTDWRFYDCIYTERYMRTPLENPDGYQQSSVLNDARKIKCNLLLVHGTADDNVHLQNSIMLSNELIKQNIQFNQIFYGNKDHSINDLESRRHLFTAMLKFIQNNL